MNQLIEVNDLLMGEHLLMETAISRENFDLMNLLVLCGNRSFTHSDFYLAELESALLAFCRRINQDLKYKEYVENLELILSKPISDDAVDKLKNILKSMQIKEGFLWDDTEIIVKQIL